MATNFTVIQGKTFQRVVRWYAPPFIYKAITAITQDAPVSLTVPSHGCPDGWLAAVVGVQGMTEINAPHFPPKTSEFKKITVVDASTVEFNEVVSSEYSTYTSGGHLMFYTPVDMSGYTARMTIKNRAGGTVLLALVSPTDIAVDNTEKTVTVTISAEDTAIFTVGSYVYDLELVSGTGVVTQLLAGKIVVTPEITT